MKPLMPLVAAALATSLCGCANSNWFHSGGGQPQYTPMQGGPGYGPTSPLSQYNAAPEGVPPADMPFSSDALGGYGGGGYGASGWGQSTGGYPASTGASGTAGATGAAGAAGGLSSEPGIGSSSPAGRDSSGTSGAAGSTGAPLDQQSMCELQRRVMAARTPDERQALMEQAMPGMSQEARERHMQMMGESCE